VTSEHREPGAERVLHSRRVFEGKIARLRVDTVQIASGRTAQREIVEHEPVVAIVPIDSDGNVVLVRQFRLATGAVLLEVPAGGVDPGETPEDAAQRELAEEIGMRAGHLERLAGFYVSPGFLTEYVHAFLASDLRDSPAEADEDEDIAVVRMPLADAVAMVERGDLRDAKSIASILLAARRIRS
jgi:nudix-type nucleoside diphosphatase (YffH/AdpP family)